MRKWKIAGASAAAVGVAGLLVVPMLLAAKPAQAPGDEPARAAQLPIGQVMLYSSGVGFFQREGSVEGDARVDLSFPVSDINDLIKSMVVRDLDGGHISAVSYDSSAPIDRTLKSFAGLGQVQIPWDGLDAEGERLAAGVYLFKVQVNARDDDGGGSGRSRAVGEGRIVILGH